MFDFEEKQSENKKEEQIDDFLKLRHTVRPMEANDLNDINAVRNAMEKLEPIKVFLRPFMNVLLWISR